MSDRSKIEWTDASWNPLRAHNLATGKNGWYCTHVTAGCEHCYAETINKRLGTGLPFKPGHLREVAIFIDPKTLELPLHWKKPRRIFVCSMSDLFGEWVTDAMLDQAFAVMALCPQHTFQVLTKRPERMREYVTACGEDIANNFENCRLGNLLVAAHINMGSPYAGNARFELLSNAEHIASHPPKARKHFHRTAGWPLPNVWLGTSCEDQETADVRVPLLLDTPAAVRFVSAEPLLGPIDLTDMCGVCFDALHGVNECKQRIDWVICGGESGPRARPMEQRWATGIRDQCSKAGVAFFFKQWGAFAPDEETRRTLHPNMIRVGKKAAGRLLDGREWNEFPQVRA